MATHIGTLDSRVELVDEPGPGAELRERGGVLDEDLERRLQAKREQARRRRTLAEGFSD